MRLTQTAQFNRSIEIKSSSIDSGSSVSDRYEKVKMRLSNTLLDLRKNGYQTNRVIKYSNRRKTQLAVIKNIMVNN